MGAGLGCYFPEVPVEGVELGGMEGRVLRFEVVRVIVPVEEMLRL